MFYIDLVSTIPLFNSDLVYFDIIIVRKNDSGDHSNKLLISNLRIIFLQ